MTDFGVFFVCEDCSHGRLPCAAVLTGDYYDLPCLCRACDQVKWGGFGAQVPMDDYGPVLTVETDFIGEYVVETPVGKPSTDALSAYLGEFFHL